VTGVGICIRFLAGRYHATPWDHQVNEGLVEWPPSPWRILRALVAAYYRLPEPVERALLNQLMEKLAMTAPNYALPRTSTAHTRHYMPIRKEGKSTTTRVFDTFLVLERVQTIVGESLPSLADAAPVLQVYWPEVELNGAEHHLLQQLCRQVSYLGRAEAWAELSVITMPLEQVTISAKPFDATADEDSTLSTQLVNLLAPLDVQGLAGFHAALAILPQPQKRGKAKWTVPTTVLEALELNIADLHSQGWNGIPGSRWIPYRLTPLKAPKRDDKPPFPQPNFARYALSSNVLPKLTAAVSVGDRFHQALIKISTLKGEQQGEAVFTGCDEHRNPLQGHQHAFYLPEDVDGDGRIDHVTVYARGGFSPPAVAALAKLRKVWSADSLDLQTVLISLGQAKDYQGNQAHSVKLLGPANTWISATPLILPRHPKVNRRGEPKVDPMTGREKDSPEDQVYRLLAQMGLPEPQHVELQEQTQISRYYLSQFQIHRSGSQRQRREQARRPSGSQRGYVFRICFADPQPGPISLGVEAHFGLGLFKPEVQ
jgi:CRISPR-associated protein Csb2